VVPEPGADPALVGDDPGVGIGVGFGVGLGVGLGVGFGVGDAAWAGGAVPGADLVDVPFHENATEPPAGTLSESTPAEA
jgi:hypothetical protein